MDMSSRIAALKSLLDQEPRNTRMRHMLANELANAGLTAEALAEYSSIVHDDPNYVPGYFQAGRLAENVGSFDTARDWYQRGLETARRTGDRHAEAEIQDALSLLGD